jgi:methylmalonyl-CoA mutase
VISEGYGQGGNDSFRMEIHCVTNQWNTTVYDPYINMLRTQTEAMSAVVGGTDSLTVNPFDIAFRRPAEFSERIARNQQLILKEEAYFDKVIDPAGGSYYIENLTALIAENSWKLFLEIEEKGGFLAALRSGFIQEKLAGSNEHRIKDVADRKEVLVGTNKYPGYNEAISVGADPQFKNDGQHDKVNMVVEPIVFSRGAEEIEKIRIAVDRASVRPKVFMLTIGNPVIRRARSQYSAGFFGCAGYEITDNEGFASVAEGADAALKSGAEIVVICSSDEEYPVVAPEIFRRLKGRTIVVVAGNPESIEELRAAGIVNFISLKSNLCDTLRLYNSLLGIKDK